MNIENKKKIIKDLVDLIQDDNVINKLLIFARECIKFCFKGGN